MHPGSEAPIEVLTGPQPSATVIWLHGLGADGHDFEALVPELRWPAEPAVRFVFPHAPMQAITINGGMVMRGWYDIRGLPIDADPDERGIRASAERMDRLVEAEIERGVAADRIVLAGFSQGGAIALHAGLRQPHRLAGIMALSTCLHLADRTTAERHAANQSTPIFVAHGRYDEVVPVALGQRSTLQLRDLGYTAEWRDYPMGHAVCLEEIAAIREWLLRVLEGPA